MITKGYPTFLNLYDDLYKRPSLIDVFGEESYTKIAKNTKSVFYSVPPIIEDIQFFVSRLKKAVLFNEKLKFPAQWLFNSPLAFSASILNYVKDDCYASRIFEGGYLIPSFGNKNENFEDLSKDFKGRVVDGKDPSAWWYDVMDKGKDGNVNLSGSNSKIIEDFIFGKYTSFLERSFRGIEAVDSYSYSDRIFNESFYYHLIKAMNNYSIDRYSHQFLSNHSNLLHILKKMVREFKDDGIWMGRFRKEIRKPALELYYKINNLNFNEEAKAIVEEEIDDFARHAYVIALSDAHHCQDAVYSTDFTTNNWKSHIINDVDRRLSGHLVAKNHHYTSIDMFLVNDYIDEAVNKTLSKYTFSSNSNNYTYLEFNRIERIRSKDPAKQYFEYMASLRWSEVDSDAEVKKVLKGIQSVLVPYCELIESEIRKCKHIVPGRGFSLQAAIVPISVGITASSLTLFLTSLAKEDLLHQILSTAIVGIASGLTASYASDRQHKIDHSQYNVKKKINAKEYDDNN